MPKPFKIIFQHNDFMAISKSPGVSFHGEQDSEGLFSHIRLQIGDTPLYPVHRLDKITSGLLIIAKNKEAAQTFANKFQNKLIDKYYLAVSDRKPQKKQGKVWGDMGPARRGMWRLFKTKKSPAITQFFSKPLESGKRLYLLKPHTGKTHQIRVAMKSISSPVLGDPLYYKESVALCDRAYLHAYSIGFTWEEEWIRLVDIPTAGELFLSSAFENTLENHYKEPWSLAWPGLPGEKG